MATLNTGAFLLAGMLAFASAGMAKDKNTTEVDNRLNTATAVFEQMMGTPSTGIPENLLARAQCIVDIPHMKKGAFIVGASHGAGFASCRTSSGSWSAPSPVSISGGSVGLQAGGQETDIVMLFMNERARNQLLASNFKLGAGTSVQAGPVGAGAQTQTGTADVYTYMSKNGAFAGASINGSNLGQDKDATKALYGSNIPQGKILQGGVQVPPAAQQFVSALNRYSSQQTRGD
jgi:lipid-binding SYLF domain-containing protein